MPTKNIQKRIAVFITVSLLVLATLIFSYLYINNKNTSNTTPKLSQSIPKSTIKDNAKTEQQTNTKNKEIIVKEKPVPLPIGTDQFTISLKDTNETIANNLLDQGYITDVNTFIPLLSGKDGKETVVPGAYKISNEMNNEQLAQVLKGKPYMKWIVIPEGLRKEEIAKLLSDTLGWSKKQKNEWIKIDTTSKPDYIEGVYFPDTYLIPIDEKPKDVALRLISKFNEKFSPYLSKFTDQNMKWTTALTLASIVQRESANDSDAPLIAGILLNRLNQKMQLGVDATLQYIRGDIGKGWWAPISVADKKVDSPYNTYLHIGLPPHPISNPGIPAIEAVLNPATTDCLYYLHDKNHITHCSKTYEEHQANIEKYLKN